LAKALDDDHAKILKRVGANEVIHPERDMALRVSRGLSRPNVLDFIPLADEFDLVQVGPPREFIGKSLRDLNLRAKYNVHIIAIKELVPENFLLVPPASFVIKDSDILIMLGKSEDIRGIKALK
jgi:trk system potassium uptake protein TrkA